jgi:hypothetical protein
MPTMSTTPSLERAQLVWRRARALAHPGEHSEVLSVALDLLRDAGYDSTMLAHGLSLGRTEVRRTDDAEGRRAILILERAVNFLGVRPPAHGLGVSRSRAGGSRTRSGSDQTHRRRRVAGARPGRLT